MAIPALPNNGAVLPVCAALAVVTQAAREACGFTRSELARRARIHRQEVAWIETGQRIPSVNVVERIGLALGHSGSWLLRRAERGGEKALHL